MKFLADVNIEKPVVDDLRRLGYDIKRVPEEPMKTRLLTRIETNPNIMFGKPVIKGTRLPVEIILEKFCRGNS